MLTHPTSSLKQHLSRKKAGLSLLRVISNQIISLSVELPMCSLGDKWDWQTVGGKQQTGGPAATTHLWRVKSTRRVVMIDAGTALVNMLHR